jgi:hypothetical protein
MKYRIENGTVTMPIDELNRLNDKGEELEKIKKDIDEKTKSRLVCTKTYYRDIC